LSAKALKKTGSLLGDWGAAQLAAVDIIFHLFHSSFVLNLAPTRDMFKKNGTLFMICQRLHFLWVGITHPVVDLGYMRRRLWAWF
jgi:hypothetical protein